MATSWTPVPDRNYHNYYSTQHALHLSGNPHPSYHPYPLPQHHHHPQLHYPYNYHPYPPPHHAPVYSSVYNNTHHGHPQLPQAQLNRRPSRATATKSVSSSNSRNKNNQKRKSKNSKKSKPFIAHFRDWLQNTTCTSTGNTVDEDAHQCGSHSRIASKKNNSNPNQLNQQCVDNCSETNTQTQQTSSSSVISTISSLSDIVYDPTLATSLDNAHQSSNHPLPPIQHHVPNQQPPVQAELEDLLPYDQSIDYAALPPVETVAYIIGSPQDPELPESIRQLFSTDEQEREQGSSLIPSSSSSLTNSHDEFEEHLPIEAQEEVEEEQEDEGEEEDDQEEMKEDFPDNNDTNFSSEEDSNNLLPMNTPSIDFASSWTYPNHDEDISPPVTTTSASISLRHSSVRNTIHHQHPAFFNNPLLHRTESPPAPVDNTGNIDIPVRRSSIRNAQADLFRHAASEHLLAGRHSSVVNARNILQNLNN